MLCRLSLSSAPIPKPNTAPTPIWCRRAISASRLGDIADCRDPGELRGERRGSVPLDLRCVHPASIEVCDFALDASCWSRRSGHGLVYDLVQNGLVAVIQLAETAERGPVGRNRVSRQPFAVGVLVKIRAGRRCPVNRRKIYAMRRRLSWCSRR